MNVNINAEKIIDKSAITLVVEANVNLRTMITNNLKSLGFENLHVSNDFATAMGILESENIDWVVSSLQTESKTNVYHALGLCTKHDSLKNTLFTVFLNEPDKKHIPHLAANGAFSWFNIRTTDEYIRSIFNELFELIESKKADPVLIAAFFYQSYLFDQGKYNEGIYLYQNLLNIYPGDPEILLATAEAQLLAGQKKDGTLTLQQLTTLSPSHQGDAQKLADQFLGGKLPSLASGSSKQNPFGIREAVLVRLDAHSHSVEEEAFKELQVPYQVMTTSEDALIYLRDAQEPTIMFHGWWQDGINAAAFLQEFRDLCPHTVLTTVFGGLDQADYALLDELNSAMVIKPPLDRQKLIEKTIWAIQQDRRPLEKKFLMNRIFQALEDENIDLAIKFKEDLEQNALANQGDIYLVTAEILLKQDKAGDAVECGINALKYNGDPVASLNVMGKAFMKLGAFDKAFQSFDQAQELSPLSIKRLCVMAEAQFEMGQTNEANELLDEARGIREDSLDILETDAKQKIADGDIEIGKDLLSKLGSIKDIIAYLNNKAVTLAIEKKFDEAIKLYQQAYDSIPDEHVKFKSTINFNLGLLFLRTGDMDRAETTLRLCTPQENRKIAEKASKIIASIEEARTKSKILKMKEKEAPPPFKLSDDSAKKIRRSMRIVKSETIITKGERCLFLIVSADSQLKLVTESLASLPAFKTKRETTLQDKKVWV
ncbi:tetratricopeptide repeat protein [Pseudobacteriovorax antillogorgiicola]|uniref:Tetratricopeptide repeat-containing protein n=1 Tax=Pseudobacteriovorax antillogorgiicola TaxID=1513793 RepID=A0A1Y6BTP6_9BACT|nr:tetratricopeptide repeat protein [Pseudobacteriovorax antillogorgiicola]TCS54595.1 tetratricopeptide repeat protein [Pseudobacteriovorax antillogorgiicola]SMF17691.1 Tetratricopeptide repeat-containing protein [Pseudobacteriovorax antillogorgiicola]